MTTKLNDPLLQINHEEIMATVASIPPLPRSGMLISELYADPNHKFADVVRAVELDPTLSGRLLHVANTASRHAGNVKSVREAVAALGGGTVRSLAMAECVRPAADLNLSFFGLTPASYWKHSVTVVCCADELVSQHLADFGSEFSIAAILHDFGKVIIARHLTSIDDDIRCPQNSDSSTTDMERQLLNVDHGQISAAVACGWDLSAAVVRAILYHHRPEMWDHPLCHGLNIANQLAWQLESKNDELHRESDSLRTSMEALGLNQQKLRTIAERGAVRLQDTLDAYV